MSNNGPDICFRCGGNMLAQRWKGEGSCLQCGYYWYYGNGHGRHFSALLIQTTPYSIKTEQKAEQGISQEIPPVEELPSSYDTPIFKDFSQFFERCAASNGGCEHCRAERKCRALYDRGSRIASQGRFNLHYYRTFSQKARNLLTTP
jgi:hypothetical protein